MQSIIPLLNESFFSRSTIVLSCYIEANESFATKICIEPFLLVRFYFAWQQLEHHRSPPEMLAARNQLFHTVLLYVIVVDCSSSWHLPNDLRFLAGTSIPWTVDLVALPLFARLRMA